MKSKELFGLVISFVMAITFCCSETQVAAVGSAAMEAKVAASNAVGLLGGLAAGLFAWLLRQKNKVAARPLVVAAGDPEEILIPVFGDEEIHIPDGLQYVGVGLQNLLDLINGLMPTDSEEEALAFLHQAERAIYAVFAGFYEHLIEILSSCGATALTGPEKNGAITFIDIDGESVMATPQMLWRNNPSVVDYPAPCRLAILWSPGMGKKPGDSDPSPQAGTVLRRYSPFSRAAITDLLAMTCGLWNPATLAEAMAGIWAVTTLAHNWCELYHQHLAPYCWALGVRDFHFLTSSPDRVYIQPANKASMETLTPVAIERIASAFECETPARLLATALSDRHPTRLLPILLGAEPYIPPQFQSVATAA
ncbi:MAG: hypothetical protein LBJ38_03395 [Oscillospiraceae bacterium]|nr:hypothetical protein [Oscillospiraceae bacterium]